MEVMFWGVRGSYPVPGPNTVRYGGQTSCVELRDRAGNPLIVDAGTGLRELGRKLARENRKRPNFHYHIVLSHVHWDHIQGLPFFEPAYIVGNSISMYALRTAADDLHHVISGITRHEFFPMPLEAAPAEFEFHEVVPGSAIRIGAFDVLPFSLNHPFGAVGYRIDADGVGVAYVSDTAPFTDVLHKRHFLSGPEALTDDDRHALDAMRRDLIAALRGVHTIIYDTHFLPEEYERFPHYGHSTPEHALDVCREVGASRLVLFHHAPSHTDAMMDKIADTYRDRGLELGIEVVTAYEHLRLPVGEPPPDAAAGGGE